MKTMRQVLAERSEQQVEELVKLWLVEGKLDKDLPARREALMKRIQDPIAAHFVWERLSTNERKIFYNVLTPSARYGIPSTMLKKKVQLSTAQYEEALDGLAQHVLLQTNIVKMKDGQVVYTTSSSKKQTASEDVLMVYAFNESVDTLYSVGRAIFSPANDRSKMSFDKILATLHENDLYQIMQNYTLQWGVYHSRSELRTMMAEKILALDDPINTLTKLDRRAHKLFTWLHEHDGRATMPEVRKFIGFSDVVLIDMLHSLAHAALAFNTFSKDTHVLFIPVDLYSSKKNIAISPTTETEPFAFVALENPPVAIRPDEPVIIYDMAVLINAMYQQTIEPTQAGKIPKRIANKLRPMLRGQPRLDYEKEDQYLEVLLSVMMMLGIVELSRPPLPDMKARYEPGRRLAEWAGLSMSQQLSVLVNTWITQGGLTDIAGIHYQPWDPYSWKVGEARNTLLIHLSECSPGQWYTIDSLIQHIWVKDTFGARPTVSPSQQTSFRKSKDMHAKWYKAEGEAYTGMLASTLHELGVVAIGYEQVDGLEVGAGVNPYAFMFTELGADVLINSEQEPSVAQPTSRTLVVQPSFELLLLQPDLKTLYSLLPFVQVNQISIASRLALTRASVLRGMETGLTLEHMLQVLQEHSQKDLPQNVVYTLQDWTKHYKDVKLSQVLLLDVSSEEAAQMIMKLPVLQGSIVRQLGPCTIAVDLTINIQELKRILEKEGIFTRISGDMPLSLSRSVFTYGMPR